MRVEFGAAVALIFAGTVIIGNTPPLARVSDRVQLNHLESLKQVHPIPLGVPTRETESGKLASDTVVTPVTLAGPVFVIRKV